MQQVGLDSFWCRKQHATSVDRPVFTCCGNATTIFGKYVRSLTSERAFARVRMAEVGRLAKLARDQPVSTITLWENKKIGRFAELSPWARSSDDLVVHNDPA